MMNELCPKSCIFIEYGACIRSPGQVCPHINILTRTGGSEHVETQDESSSTLGTES